MHGCYLQLKEPFSVLSGMKDVEGVKPSSSKRGDVGKIDVCDGAKALRR